MIERLLMADVQDGHQELEAEPIVVLVTDDAATFQLGDGVEITFRRDDLLEILGVELDELDLREAARKQTAA